VQDLLRMLATSEALDALPSLHRGVAARQFFDARDEWYCLLAREPLATALGSLQAAESAGRVAAREREARQAELLEEQDRTQRESRTRCEAMRRACAAALKGLAHEVAP
jgi:hypothetical protein